jgi:lipid-A-disaccharide synthase
MPLKFYLVAGEKSGDLHGGNLIQSIRKLHPDAEFRGFGGDQMAAAGMHVVVHYNQMAFMGIVQVVMNIRRILGWMKICRRDLQQYQPDALILIDYGGFNMRLAKYAHAKGYRIYYYIAPKVWAWNTGRALKLKATVDRMFSILPFEPDFFKRFNWKVDYVGNPVVDAVQKFIPDPDFSKKHNLSDRPVVALLPGSRRGELSRILPLLASVTENFPAVDFVVAAIRELPQELYQLLQNRKNVRFVFDATYDLLNHARAAIVTSGTATLETALFNVPQVVVYRASALEYAIGSRVIKVDFISLVNLIAGRMVVKELLQDAATTIHVNSELEALLKSEARRAEIFSGYAAIGQLLQIGSASDNTARLMLEDLKQL